MYSLREIMLQLRESFEGVDFDLEAYEKGMEDLNKQLEDGTVSEEEYADKCEELAATTLKAADAQKAELAASLAGKNALSGLLSIVSASDDDFNKLASAIA